MKKIFVIGGVSFNTMVYLERFPQPESQTLFIDGFHETVGSSGAGKALNLNKLDFEVTLHGLIGEDRFGDQIKEYFQAQEIEFFYDVDPLGTRRHINLMNAQGERISIFLVDGTFDPEVDLDPIEASVVQSDGVVLGLLNYCRQVISLIKKYNKPIWYDIHDYDGINPYHQDFIDAADYLLMSSEAMPGYRDFMADLIDRGKKLVICTHGRGGATGLTPEGEWVEVPIISDFDRRRKDTNGAGDGFFSGVLLGLASEFSLEKSLQER